MKIVIYSDNTLAIHNKCIGTVKAVSKNGIEQNATGHYGQSDFTTRIYSKEKIVDLDFPPYLNGKPNAKFADISEILQNIL